MIVGSEKCMEQSGGATLLGYVGRGQPAVTREGEE